MKKKIINTLLAFCWTTTLFAADGKPNIVFIFADDMGYGDVHVLNPERGKIKTPHMDKLASEGMVFTDAHTSSSVCTPSRYSLLTGRYHWRTQLQSGVLWGFSEPLIAENRMTVADVLKEKGYRTAMIGKWHLGMIQPTPNGVLPQGRTPRSVNIQWDGQIKRGPTSNGFDSFYGIAASLDMAPYIFIKDDRFDGEIPQDGKTITAKGFDKSEVLPEIGRKTVEFIKQQNAERPFFAYVPLTSPHTPILPTEEWKGKSGLGSYGDFQMQTDAVVGQIVDAIDAAGLAENTLIIVSSDNGCSKAAKIPALEKQGHYPSAHFRGSKADLWEGGHRVPFIVRWPALVKAGSESDATICLTDFFATCAELVGKELPADSGEDSVSFLPALKGEPIQSERAGIIHHSISGHFAYRQGKWKLLLAKGSGGWTSPTEVQAKSNPLAAQLYDLEADTGETKNLYESNPEVAAKLLAQLETDVMRGRSTAGADQKNDIEDIVLWKGGAKPRTTKDK